MSPRGHSGASWDAAFAPPPTPARASFADRFWPFLLFALTAVSSIVQKEPAPYDFVLMASMGLFLISGPRIPTGLVWPTLCVVLILFGYAIGGLFAIFPTESLLYMRTSAYLSVSCLFFAAIIWQAPERAVPPMMAGLVIASSIAAALGIAGYFGAIPNAESFAIYGRATGPYKDPNVFGPSLIFPALYLAHRLATRPMREMLWCLPLFLLLMLGLFLSFSRGAWMDFSVAASVFLVLSYATAEPAQRTRLVGFTLFLTIVGALAIAVALSIPEVSKLFMQRFAVAQDYDTGEGGRFDSMLAALKMALTYPLGIGPDNWPRISSVGLMPHDIYVNVFVSGGLVALAGFGGLTLLTIWAGYRALKLRPALSGVLIVALGTFCGHAVEGFFIDSNHWRHLYIVVGLVWGLALTSESNARRAAAPPPY